MRKNVPWNLQKFSNYKIWFEKVLGKTGDMAVSKRDEKYINFLIQSFPSIFDKYKSCNILENESIKGIPLFVWVLWWDVDKKIPENVQECIKRLKKYCPDVRFLSKNNIDKYIDISDVLPLINFSGKNYNDFHVQYLSDIIRMRLLRKYGGWWMDSTMFLTSADIFSYSNKVDFFSIHYKYQKGTAVDHGKWTTFCFAAVPNHPIFCYLDDILSAYIKTYTKLLHYSWIDYCLEAGYVSFDWLRKCVDNIPFSNPYVWWLQQNYDQLYDDLLYRNILKHTTAFKYNWRIKESNDPLSVWNQIKRQED